MAKFYGAIGYIVTEETALDVHTEIPVERLYKGDLIKNYRRTENGIGINPDVTISNQISIVADPYARNHIHDMRYVKWMGAAWTVSSVDVQYPRLILSLGGLYKGETA